MTLVIGLLIGTVIGFIVGSGWVILGVWYLIRHGELFVNEHGEIMGNKS